jgi:RNA polymerase sigma-70 factor (ECF subfamily)
VIDRGRVRYPFGVGDATDDDLLNAWRGGDRDAGTQLIVRHFDSVHRFFWSKLGDPAKAEDLVQRTFLACVESQARYRGASSFRVFLLGIAYHQLLGLFRHQERNARAMHTLGAAESLDASPASLLAAQDEHRLLLRALRQLPFDLQVVVELHYWESMAVDDIAVVLSIPAGTVKSRLHRGRQLLRTTIVALASSTTQAASVTGQLDDWARSLRSLLARDPDNGAG